MAARTGGRSGRMAVAAVAVLVGIVGAIAPAGAAPPGDERTTPISPDHAFVRVAYLDLLGREPTAAQLGHRLGQLEAGRTRTQVASELTHSAEHARRVVDQLYRRILGRGADPAGSEFWSPRLVAGVPVATLAAQLYASQEVYDGAGATPAGYVDAVYANLLGRAPDAAGRSYWAGRVAAGESRTVLARSLYLSPEANGLRATLVYLELLRRPALLAERPFWAERLRTMDLLDLEARLLGSDEYGAVVQRPDVLTVTDVAAGVAAAPSISADGRIVAFAAVAGRLAPGGGSGGQGALVVLDRLTGRYRQTGRAAAWPQGVEVSADGSTVAFSSAASTLVAGDTNGRTDVFLLRLAGGGLRRVTDGESDSTEPSLDGDGTTIAFASGSDVAVGAVSANGVLSGVEQLDDASQPSLSADGSALVYAAGARHHWAPLPLADDDDVVLSEHDLPGSLPFSGPSVSADGDVVGYASGLTGDDDPAGVFTGRVEGGEVADRARYGDEVAPLRIVVADGGTGVLVDHVESVSGHPFLRGRYHASPEAEPVVVGFGGELTADAHLAIGMRQATTVSTRVLLWELG